METWEEALAENGFNDDEPPTKMDGNYWWSFHSMSAPSYSVCYGYAGVQACTGVETPDDLAAMMVVSKEVFGPPAEAEEAPAEEPEAEPEV